MSTESTVPSDTIRTGTILAGVAREVLRVPTGSPIGGWGSRPDHANVGTHRPIEITALWVAARPSSGDRAEVNGAAVLITCDAVEWPPSVARPIREAVASRLGLPLDAVLLAATHTHSSVMISDAQISAWDRDGTALRTRNRLADLIVEAAGRAADAPQEVEILVTRRRCRVARSRRQQVSGRMVVGVAEPVEDAAVEAIELRRGDGQTLATVVAFGSHPTVLSWGNLQVSPDYPASVREVMEAEFSAPCLFFQGCGGDRSPVYSFSNSIADAETVGRAVGHVAAGALMEERQAGQEVTAVRVLESGASLCITTASDPSSDAPARVAVLRHSVELPLRDRDLAATRARLADLEPGRLAGDPPAVADFAKALIQEDICVRFPTGDAGTVDVYGIAIGPLLIVGWPLELSGAYDAAMRAQAPDHHLVVVTTVNDYMNYLPWSDQFAEGGYEVDATPFTVAAPELAVLAIGELARRISSGEVR